MAAGTKTRWRMLPWGGTTWPLGKRQDGSVPTTSIPCSPAWDNQKQCWTNSWKLDCLCHNDCLFPDGCVCLWPAVLSSPLFLALQSAASLSPCGCLPSAHAAGCVLCWAWGHHCYFSQSGACTLMGSGPSPLFSHLGSAFVTQQCFLLSELCILRTRKAWAVEREGRVHRGWSQQPLWGRERNKLLEFWACTRLISAPELQPQWCLKI